MSDLDYDAPKRTPRTWGENVWPTAQQLADWLAVCTPTERVTHATIAIQDGQRADACLAHNHDARLLDLAQRAEAAEAAVERVRALADERDEWLAEDIAAHEAKHPGNRAAAYLTTAEVRAALDPAPASEVRDDEGGA